MSDDLSEFERGQASAIAVLALEETLARKDMLVLHNMFPHEVLMDAYDKIDGNQNDSVGDELPHCPHGHGEMIRPIAGDPLEPMSPYCPECGHIHGNDCDDGCHYDG